MTGPVAVLLLFAGGFTLSYALRGDREGNDLRCPNERCGYPLRDIAEANAERRPWSCGEHNLPTVSSFPVTCPECGRVDARSRDAARGEFRRRPIAVGVALLLAGAALGGWIVFAALAPGASSTVRGLIGI